MLTFFKASPVSLRSAVRVEEFLIAPWLYSKSYDIEGSHVGISRTWECQANHSESAGASLERGGECLHSSS